MKRVSHYLARSVAEDQDIPYDDHGIVDSRYLGYCEDDDHLRLLEAIREKEQELKNQQVDLGYRDRTRFPFMRKTL